MGTSTPLSLNKPTKGDYAVYKPVSNTVKFRKWAPGLIIFRDPFEGLIFWRGLYSEGLMYGGKFASQNLLGWPYSWRKFTVFALFCSVFEGKFQVQVPGSLYSEGRLNEGVFCVTSLGALYLEGLIHGGSYFRNFTVCHKKATTNCWWSVRVFTSLYLAIHTIHYLLEKDLKILDGFPEIDQKAEEMRWGGGEGGGEREIKLPKIDTIHVIIIEAALLFCAPSPSMLILKKF